MTMDMSLKNAISEYYWLGFPYKDIVTLLEIYHGISISVRTLIRHLADMGLSRRNKPSALIDVWNSICHELQGSGRCCGYRMLRRKIQLRYHLHVTNETVRFILRQLDPISVSNRRQHRLQRRTYNSAGPNNTWHIDGYDKLLRYGFGISGCLDGFSRRIIWLECSSSNHDPAVIAGYYLKAVNQLNILPQKLRTDCGTENVTVAALHTFLTGQTNDHIYGSSPSNQRIEGWWSFFRRLRSQWWIELFESLIEADSLNIADPHEVDCLRFCFMSVLRNDLLEVVRMWNTHRIRPSNGSVCPAGIPEILFRCPEPPAVDCAHRFIGSLVLPQDVLDQMKPTSTCADKDFEQYLTYICNFHGWATPETVEDAVNMFICLCRVIRQFS